ncbi:MAG: hypothetical protein AAFU79_26405 [Myxococcota bacterium]
MAIAIATFTLLSGLAGAPGDAPMRLVTDHGIELSANEEVFTLFAALNAAGYAEEPKRKGPPLNAPVFHPIREDVREALRAAKSTSSLTAVRKVFETHPETIATYIEAALSMAPDAPRPSSAASALAKKLAPLGDFRSEASLATVFDRVAGDQRALMKELASALEKDLEAVRKVLGDPGFRAPRAVVVVPNPLDGHGLVRRLTLGGVTYLVVGPGLDEARTAILQAALEPSMSALVATSYGRAGKLSRSWSTLKTSKRITRRWPNGKAYLADALTHAVAHRARAGGTATRDADEEFVDVEAKDGMRWARTALKILDDHGSGKLADALPNLLAKASP